MYARKPIESMPSSAQHAAAMVEKTVGMKPTVAIMSKAAAAHLGAVKDKERR